MTRKTNQKGFTLIELLITVAIVAILATIALPAYSIYKDRARFAEVIHAVETAKTAVDVCVHTRGSSNCIAGTTLDVPNGSDAAAYVANGGVTFVSGPAGGPYVIQSTAANDGATDASGTVTVDWNDNTVGGLTFRIVGTVNSATNSVVWEENPTGNVGTCVAAGLC